MTAFPDITPAIRAAAPALRGRLLANPSLADLTWFRVGGPAQVLFTPADEEDLAHLLGALDPETPVTVIGLGSNLIVRDGGIPGVTIRLGGKAFGSVEIDGETLRAGTAVPDMRLAKAAAEASLDGLAFFRGIPGSIGGALRMNAGAHGGETTDVLVEARGIDRSGALRCFTHAEMGFTYRHSASPEDVIFTSALFRGRPRRPPRHRSGNGPRHRRARGGPADPRAHRRLDLQEPAGRPRRGSSSMRPAAGGSPWAAPRSRRCTATS